MCNFKPDETSLYIKGSRGKHVCFYLSDVQTDEKDIPYTLCP